MAYSVAYLVAYSIAYLMYLAADSAQCVTHRLTQYLLTGLLKELPNRMPHNFRQQIAHPHPFDP